MTANSPAHEEDPARDLRPPSIHVILREKKEQGRAALATATAAGRARSMAATSDAAKHLYWSKAPSNTPPSALTAEKAKAQKADADVSDKEWTPLCALLANPRARPIRRCSHVLFSTRARADKWGQKYQKIILTIFVPCLEDDAVKVDVKPKALSFRAERVAAFAGNKMEKRIYTLSLEFLAEVDGDSAEIHLRHDHVRVELPKVVKKPWRSLQAAHIPKNSSPVTSGKVHDASSAMFRAHVTHE